MKMSCLQASVGPWHQLNPKTLLTLKVEQYNSLSYGTLGTYWLLGHSVGPWYQLCHMLAMHTHCIP